MSYPFPYATQIPTIGLDGAITRIQSAIGALSWLPKVFHRAYVHEEIQGTRTITVPKTWEAANEWQNVLPNDNLTAQAFFYPVSDERVTESEPHVWPLMEADIAVIVWCNTTKLIGHITGPSLAEEKSGVIAILMASDVVTTINSVVDKSAPDVFDPFTVDDDQRHWTMLPYAGFRIEFTVKFSYDNCGVSSS